MLQEILRLPGCPQRLNVLFPRIFLALLSQIFFATQQMPEEVDTFWRGCQQEGCPPTNPSRCSTLVLPSLAWPWSQGLGSQRDLGFALHTDLQC